MAFWGPLLEVLGWVAGTDWPEGDEDEMLALADDWQALAKELAAVESLVQRAEKSSLAVYPEGDGSAQIVAMFKSLLYRTDNAKDAPSIDELVEQLGVVGQSVHGVATEIQYAKWMMYGALIMLATEIAWSAFAAPWASAIAAAIVRKFIGRVAQRTLLRIPLHLVGKVTTFAVRDIGFDTAIGAGQDALTQYLQTQAGTRDKVNWNQVKASAAGGAGGALAASAVGRQAGRLVPRSAAGMPTVPGLITGGVAGTAGWIGGIGGSMAWQLYSEGRITIADGTFAPHGAAGGFAGGALPGGARSRAMTLHGAGIQNRVNTFFGLPPETGPASSPAGTQPAGNSGTSAGPPAGPGPAAASAAASAAGAAPAATPGDASAAGSPGAAGSPSAPEQAAPADGSPLAGEGADPTSTPDSAGAAELSARAKGGLVETDSPKESLGESLDPPTTAPGTKVADAEPIVSSQQDSPGHGGWASSPDEATTPGETDGGPGAPGRVSPPPSPDPSVVGVQRDPATGAAVDPGQPKRAGAVAVGGTPTSAAPVAVRRAGPPNAQPAVAGGAHAEAESPQPQPMVAARADRAATPDPDIDVPVLVPALEGPDVVLASPDEPIGGTPDSDDGSTARKPQRWYGYGPEPLWWYGDDFVLHKRGDAEGTHRTKRGKLVGGEPEPKKPRAPRGRRAPHPPTTPGYVAAERANRRLFTLSPEAAQRYADLVDDHRTAAPGPDALSIAAEAAAARDKVASGEPFKLPGPLNSRNIDRTIAELRVAFPDSEPDIFLLDGLAEVASRAANELRRISEEMGKVAARDLLTHLADGPLHTDGQWHDDGVILLVGGPGRTIDPTTGYPFPGGGGPYRLDVVAIIPGAPPRVVVIEAKGGMSRDTLETRALPDGRKAEQGALPYLHNMIAIDKDLNAVLDGDSRLRTAFDMAVRNGDLDYLRVFAHRDEGVFVDDFVLAPGQCLPRSLGNMRALTGNQMIGDIGPVPPQGTSAKKAEVATNSRYRRYDAGDIAEGDYTAAIEVMKAQLLAMEPGASMLVTYSYAVKNKHGSGAHAFTIVNVDGMHVMMWDKRTGYAPFPPAGEQPPIGVYGIPYTAPVRDENGTLVTPGQPVIRRGAEPDDVPLSAPEQDVGAPTDLPKQPNAPPEMVFHEGVDYRRIDPNHPAITEMLGQTGIFRKIAVVTARVAIGGERVRTQLASGLGETVNVAKAGQMIVRNPGGEEYIVDRDKFEAKYYDLGNGQWQAFGLIRAIINPFGVPVVIRASWGDQFGAADCFLATDFDPDNPTQIGPRRRIIGAAEFGDTYRRANPASWPSFPHDGGRAPSLAAPTASEQPPAPRRLRTITDRLLGRDRQSPPPYEGSDAHGMGVGRPRPTSPPAGGVSDMGLGASGRPGPPSPSDPPPPNRCAVRMLEGFAAAHGVTMDVGVVDASGMTDRQVESLSGGQLQYLHHDGRAGLNRALDDLMTLGVGATAMIVDERGYVAADGTVVGVLSDIRLGVGSHGATLEYRGGDLFHLRYGTEDPIMVRRDPTHGLVRLDVVPDGKRWTPLAEPVVTDGSLGVFAIFHRPGGVPVHPIRPVTPGERRLRSRIGMSDGTLTDIQRPRPPPSSRYVTPDAQAKQDIADALRQTLAAVPVNREGPLSHEPNRQLSVDGRSYAASYGPRGEFRGIFGRVNDDGVLSIALQRGESAPAFRELFNGMFAHLGARTQTIRLSAPPGLTRSEIEPVVAPHGFTFVEVLPGRIEGTVEVIFTRRAPAASADAPPIRDSRVAFARTKSARDDHNVPPNEGADDIPWGAGVPARLGVEHPHIRHSETPVNQCAVRMLAGFGEAHGLGLEIGAVSAAGMTASEVETHAGAWMVSVGHGLDGLATALDELTRRGPGSTVMLIDERGYRRSDGAVVGEMDVHGVGSHGVTLEYQGKDVFVLREGDGKSTMLRRDPIHGLVGLTETSGGVQWLPLAEPVVIDGSLGVYAIFHGAGAVPVNPLTDAPPVGPFPAARPRSRIGLSADDRADRVETLLRRNDIGARAADLLFGGGPLAVRFDTLNHSRNGTRFDSGELTVAVDTDGTGDVRQALALAHAAGELSFVADGTSVDSLWHAKELNQDDYVRGVLEQKSTGFAWALEYARREGIDVGDSKEIPPPTGVPGERRDKAANDRAMVAAARRMQEQILAGPSHEVTEYGDELVRAHAVAYDMGVAEHLSRYPQASDRQLVDAGLAESARQLYDHIAARQWDDSTTEQHLREQWERLRDTRHGPYAEPVTPPPFQDDERAAADRREAAQRDVRTADFALIKMLWEVTWNVPRPTEFQLVRASSRSLREKLLSWLRVVARLDPIPDFNSPEMQRQMLARLRDVDLEIAYSPSEWQLALIHYAQNLGVDRDALNRADLSPVQQEWLAKIHRRRLGLLEIADHLALRDELLAIKDGRDAPMPRPLARLPEAVLRRMLEVSDLVDGSAVAQRADAILRRRGVHIVHQNNADTRYHPSKNRLVIDFSRNDAAVLEALAAGAEHAEAHHAALAAGVARDPALLSRTDFRTRMLDDEAAAHARAIQQRRELRESGLDILTDPTERRYTAAYDKAVGGGSPGPPGRAQGATPTEDDTTQNPGATPPATGHRGPWTTRRPVGPGDQPPTGARTQRTATSAELEAVGHAAGIAAIRRNLPRAYTAFYDSVFDAAHGAVPEEPVRGGGRAPSPAETGRRDGVVQRCGEDALLGQANQHGWTDRGRPPVAGAHGLSGRQVQDFTRGHMVRRDDPDEVLAGLRELGDGATAVLVDDRGLRAADGAPRPYGVGSHAVSVRYNGLVDGVPSYSMWHGPPGDESAWSWIPLSREALSTKETQGTFAIFLHAPTDEGPSGSPAHPLAEPAPARAAMPDNRIGQSYDTLAGRVEEMLSLTPTGIAALATYAEVGIRPRLAPERIPGPDGDRDGLTLIQRARIAVREAAALRRWLDGDTVKTPYHPLTMSEEDYLTIRLAEQTAAFLAEMDFYVELTGVGWQPTNKPQMAYEWAYRQGEWGNPGGGRAKLATHLANIDAPDGYPARFRAEYRRALAEATDGQRRAPSAEETRRLRQLEIDRLRAADARRAAQDALAAQLADPGEVLTTVEANARRAALAGELGIAVDQIHRVDLTGEPRERRAAIARAEHRGRVRDSLRAQLAEAPAGLDPLADAAARREAELRAALDATDIGVAARRTLRHYGVTVELGLAEDARYHPYRRRLVLDVAGSDSELVTAYVLAAEYAVNATSGRSAGIVRKQLASDPNVTMDELLAEEVAARIKAARMRQALRDAGYDVPITDIDQIYEDTYTGAYARYGRYPFGGYDEDTRRILSLDAVTRAFTAHLKSTRILPGRTYIDIYQRVWDELNEMPVNTCGTDVQWGLRRHNNWSDRPVRPSGLDGTAPTILQEFTGGWMVRSDNEAAALAELASLGVNASAVLIDERSWIDEHGVGSHAVYVRYDGTDDHGNPLFSCWYEDEPLYADDGSVALTNYGGFATLAKPLATDTSINTYAIFLGPPRIDDAGANHGGVPVHPLTDPPPPHAATPLHPVGTGTPERLGAAMPDNNIGMTSRLPAMARRVLTGTPRGRWAVGVLRDNQVRLDVVDGAVTEFLVDGNGRGGRLVVGSAASPLAVASNVMSGAALVDDAVRRGVLGWPAEVLAREDVRAHLLRMRHTQLTILLLHLVGVPTADIAPVVGLSRLNVDDHRMMILADMSSAVPELDAAPMALLRDVEAPATQAAWEGRYAQAAALVADLGVPTDVLPRVTPTGVEPAGGYGLPHAAQGTASQRQPFLDWFRARDADADPRQSVRQHLEMLGLDVAQARRWLTEAGVDPGECLAADPVPPPYPTPQDTPATWSAALRTYLALSPAQLDALTDAPPGTWAGVELGAPLALAPLRALLRRVPGARELYGDLADTIAPALSHNGTPAFPEGYLRSNRYAGVNRAALFLSQLRVQAGLTQRQAADAAGLSEVAVSSIESRARRPRRSDIAALLDAYVEREVTADEVAECFGLPKTAVIHPAFEDSTSFFGYAEHFCRVNRIPRHRALPLLGVHTTIAWWKGSLPEHLVMKAFDETLSRHGSWNTLAQSWGYSDLIYRSDSPAPTPQQSHSFGQWIKALRLQRRMSESDLFDLVDRSPSWLYAFERGRATDIYTLRLVRDAMGIPLEVFRSALIHFEICSTQGNPDENAEFWDLIDTPCHSPQEEAAQHRIVERHLGIAQQTASRWRGNPEFVGDLVQYRQDLLQFLSVKLMTAVLTHRPGIASFAHHARATCRGQALRFHFTTRYRVPEYRDLRVVVEVSAYCRRNVKLDGRYPDADEIEQALEHLTREQIDTALQEITRRPGESLDAPLPDTEDQTRQVAAAQLDPEFSMAIRDALADLPDPVLAQNLVILCLHDEERVGAAARTLGMEPDDAAALLESALERLRSAFRPGDGVGDDSPLPRWTDRDTQTEVPVDPRPDRPPTGGGWPSDLLEPNDVREVLARQKPRYLEIMLLCAVGWSMDDIAESTGLARASIAAIRQTVLLNLRWGVADGEAVAAALTATRSPFTLFEQATRCEQAAMLVADLVRRRPPGSRGDGLVGLWHRLLAEADQHRLRSGRGDVVSVVADLAGGRLELHLLRRTVGLPVSTLARRWGLSDGRVSTAVSETLWKLRAPMLGGSPLWGRLTENADMSLSWKYRYGAAIAHVDAAIGTLSGRVMPDPYAMARLEEVRRSLQEWAGLRDPVALPDVSAVAALSDVSAVAALSDMSAAADPDSPAATLLRLLAGVGHQRLAAIVLTQVVGLSDGEAGRVTGLSAGGVARIRNRELDRLRSQVPDADTVLPSLFGLRPPRVSDAGPLARRYGRAASLVERVVAHGRELNRYGRSDLNTLRDLLRDKARLPESVQVDGREPLMRALGERGSAEAPRDDGTDPITRDVVDTLARMNERRIEFYLLRAVVGLSEADVAPIWPAGARGIPTAVYSVRKMLRAVIAADDEVWGALVTPVDETRPLADRYQDALTILDAYSAALRSRPRADPFALARLASLRSAIDERAGMREHLDQPEPQSDPVPQDRAQELLGHLAGLDARHTGLILLTQLVGLTGEEAAGVMGGIAPSTAWSTVKDQLARLRSRMSDADAALAELLGPRVTKAVTPRQLAAQYARAAGVAQQIATARHNLDRYARADLSTLCRILIERSQPSPDADPPLALSIDADTLSQALAWLAQIRVRDLEVVALRMVGLWPAHIGAIVGVDQAAVSTMRGNVLLRLRSAVPGIDTHALFSGLLKAPAEVTSAGLAARYSQVAAFVGELVALRHASGLSDDGLSDLHARLFAAAGVNQCGPDVVAGWRAHHGLPARALSVGAEGTSQEQLETELGGWLVDAGPEAGSPSEVVAAMMELGDGATAVLVDERSVVDRHGVGAHAVLLRRSGSHAQWEVTPGVWVDLPSDPAGQNAMLGSLNSTRFMAVYHGRGPTAVHPLSEPAPAHAVRMDTHIGASEPPAVAGLPESARRVLLSTPQGVRALEVLGNNKIRVDLVADAEMRYVAGEGRLVVPAGDPVTVSLGVVSGSVLVVAASRGGPSAEAVAWGGEWESYLAARVGVEAAALAEGLLHRELLPVDSRPGMTPAGEVYWHAYRAAGVGHKAGVAALREHLRGARVAPGGRKYWEMYVAQWSATRTTRTTRTREGGSTVAPTAIRAPVPVATQTGADWDAGTSGWPSELLARGEVRDCLARQTPRRLETLLLRLVGLSVDEIVGMAGLRHGSVKSMQAAVLGNLSRHVPDGPEVVAALRAVRRCQDSTERGSRFAQAAALVTDLMSRRPQGLSVDRLAELRDRLVAHVDPLLVDADDGPNPTQVLDRRTASLLALGARGDAEPPHDEGTDPITQDAADILARMSIRQLELYLLRAVVGLSKDDTAHWWGTDVRTVVRAVDRVRGRLRAAVVADDEVWGTLIAPVDEQRPQRDRYQDALQIVDALGAAMTTRPTTNPFVVGRITALRHALEERAGIRDIPEQGEYQPVSVSADRTQALVEYLATLKARHVGLILLTSTVGLTLREAGDAVGEMHASGVWDVVTAKLSWLRDNLPDVDAMLAALRGAVPAGTLPPGELAARFARAAVLVRRIAAEPNLDRYDRTDLDTLCRILIERSLIVDATVNQCGPRAVAAWRRAHGLSAGEELLVDATGMSGAELEQELSGRMVGVPGGPAAAVAEMLRLGEGATAVLVDERAVADEHGVGAHAVAMRVFQGRAQWEVSPDVWVDVPLEAAGRDALFRSPDSVRFFAVYHQVGPFPVRGLDQLALAGADALRWRIGSRDAEYPAFEDTASFLAYVELFCQVNGLSQRAAAPLLGVNVKTLYQAAKLSRPLDELVMLRAYDVELHRRGSWNDMARAWGYSYRMDPDGEVDPDPQEFEMARDWVRAMRLRHRLTQVDLDRLLGPKVNITSRVASGRLDVTPEFIRNLGAVLNISPEMVAAAIDRFGIVREHAPPPELVALRNYTGDQAGWNRLAQESGYSYRMDLTGETDPDPERYGSLGEWITAHRLFRRLTQYELAELIGRSKTLIANVEAGRSVDIRVLRSLRDALNIPSDTFRFAMLRFEVVSAQGDPNEVALFGELIDTRHGSMEERAVQDRILEQHQWIAEDTARRWRGTPEFCDALVVRLTDALRTAILNHRPLGVPFATHARATCLGMAQAAEADGTGASGVGASDALPDVPEPPRPPVESTVPTPAPLPEAQDISPGVALDLEVLRLLESTPRGRWALGVLGPLAHRIQVVGGAELRYFANEGYLVVSAGEPMAVSSDVVAGAMLVQANGLGGVLADAVGWTGVWESYLEARVEVQAQAAAAATQHRQQLPPGSRPLRSPTDEVYLRAFTAVQMAEGLSGVEEYRARHEAGVAALRQHLRTGRPFAAAARYIDLYTGQWSERLTTYNMGIVPRGPLPPAEWPQEILDRPDFQELLAQLAPRALETLILALVGLSAEEIATSMGVTVSTVHSAMAMTIGTLRRAGDSAAVRGVMVAARAPGAPEHRAARYSQAAVLVGALIRQRPGGRAERYSALYRRLVTEAGGDPLVESPAEPAALTSPASQADAASVDAVARLVGPHLERCLLRMVVGLRPADSDSEEFGGASDVRALRELRSALSANDWALRALLYPVDRQRPLPDRFRDAIAVVDAVAEVLAAAPTPDRYASARLEVLRRSLRERAGWHEPDDPAPVMEPANSEEVLLRLLVAVSPRLREAIRTVEALVLTRVVGLRMVDAALLVGRSYNSARVTQHNLLRMLRQEVPELDAVMLEVFGPVPSPNPSVAELTSRYEFAAEVVGRVAAWAGDRDRYRGADFATLQTILFERSQLPTAEPRPDLIIDPRVKQVLCECTVREIEVLVLTMASLSGAQVGAELNMTAAAVKQTLVRIRAILRNTVPGVSAQLEVEALLGGLWDPLPAIDPAAARRRYRQLAEFLDDLRALRRASWRAADGLADLQQWLANRV